MTILSSVAYLRSHGATLLNCCVQARGGATSDSLAQARRAHGATDAWRMKRRGVGTEGFGAPGSVGVAPVRDRSLVIGAGDRGLVLFGYFWFSPLGVLQMIVCGAV